MEKTNSQGEDVCKNHSDNDFLESLELYRDFIENSSLVLIIIDKEKKIRKFNTKATSLFGYKKDELLNLNILEFFSHIKMDVENEDEVIEKFLNNEIIENIEAEIRKKNGEINWINFSIKPIVSKQDEIIGHYFMGLDISKNKKIEVNLKYSEEKYKSIFNSMKNAVLIYEVKNNGQDIIIKNINKSAEQIEKVNKENLIGKNVLDVFPSVEDFGLLKVFRRVWRTGIPEKHPLSFYKDNRIEGWRENYIYKLSSGELVAVYEDLTKKVKNDRILRESEKNLNQVLNFEKMITSISSKFVGNIDFDKAINDTLKSIGISKMVSRVYVFSFDKEKEYMMNTHEWCAESINPHMEFYKLTPLSDFPAAMEKIFQGKYISVEDSSNTIKPTTNLKKALANRNVKATLTFPIYIHNEVSGFIGFDDEINPRNWNPEDFSLLKITSQIIGNVLERKIAEKKLKESEEKYRLISEDSDDLIIVRNENLTLDYLNEDTHSRVLGYPSNLFWKQAFRNSLIHKDDVKRYGITAREGYEKGYFKLQVRYRHAEGHYLWFERTGKAFYDKNRDKKMLIVGRDITDIKLAERNTKESEEKYRNILESIKEGYFEVDLHGNFTFFNSALCEIFGYPREMLLNMNYSELCDQDIIKYLFKEYNTLLKNKGGFKMIEYPQKKKNGQIIYIESSVYLKDGVDGDFTGFKGLVRNVSERKKSEALRKEFSQKLEEEVELRTNQLTEALEKQKLYLDQIIQSSHFKTEFLATMSHELRTPLNSMIGFTDLLLEGDYGSLNSDQLTFIKDIKSSADYQFNMISQILDISNIESGQNSLKIENIQLYSFVNNIISTLRSITDKKKLIIEMRGVKKKQIVKADPLKLKLIIENILSNAIKFTEKGYIIISFTHYKGGWELLIKDSGIGIAEENFGLIFKDFKKIRSDFVVSTPGSGLGLALTKRIVELHGGSISFSSKLGEGSTFRIRIPNEPEKIRISSIDQFLNQI